MTLEAITPPTKEMKAMRLLDCMLIATEKLCFYAGFRNFTLFFKSLVQMYRCTKAGESYMEKGSIHRQCDSLTIRIRWRNGGCDGCDGCMMRTGL